MGAVEGDADSIRDWAINLPQVSKIRLHNRH